MEKFVTVNNKKPIQNEDKNEIKEDSKVQQTCLTKFFKVDGKQNFEYLFQKEEAERKAREKKEKDRLREIAKDERRAAREAEVKEQSERQRKREEESKNREREREAKYEGALIVDGIYIGSRLSAQNYDWLTQTFGELGYILNVSSDTSNYYEEEARFVYKKIKISDDSEENISDYFEEGCKFIAEALNNDRCILVHCREGKSRSVTMVIAYLMIKKGWVLEKAYQHVVKVLPWKESINQGFKIQLMNLDLKREGKEELSLDFYSRRSRRSSQRINYCEEEVKPNRRKKKEQPKKTNQMLLSFEAYWKILSGEKNQTGTNSTDTKTSTSTTTDLTIPPQLEEATSMETTSSEKITPLEISSAEITPMEIIPRENTPAATVNNSAKKTTENISAEITTDNNYTKKTTENISAEITTQNFSSMVIPPSVEITPVEITSSVGSISGEKKSDVMDCGNTEIKKVEPTTDSTEKHKHSKTVGNDDKKESEETDARVEKKRTNKRQRSTSNSPKKSRKRMRNDSPSKKKQQKQKDDKEEPKTDTESESTKKGEKKTPEKKVKKTKVTKNSGNDHPSSKKGSKSNSDNISPKNNSKSKKLIIIDDEHPSPKKESNPKKESVDENSTSCMNSTDPPKLVRKSSSGVTSPKKRQKKEETIQTKTILSYFKPIQKN